MSVILPIMINYEWQRIMTECAIKMMRACTKVDYELIIVETGSKDFDDNLAGTYKYLHFDKGPDRSYTKDFNAAIDIAESDIIVQTANDIFVQPGWLEAIVECFDKYPDCGMATIASKEAKHPVVDIIKESVCFPLIFGFKKGFRFDEAFPNNVSEQDLIMDIYSKGLRMYRNFKVTYYHLIKATMDNGGNMEDGKVAMDRFKQKWKGNNTLMFDAMVNGWVI